MGHLKNERGFTLVELMLSTLLMSILFLTVWDIFSQCSIFWRRAGDKVDLYDSLRISLDRMCREIICAKNISTFSDVNSLTFVNADGDTIRYYCNLNELLRREKGVSSPLASDIVNVSFTYTTNAGLVIDQTNIAGQKLLPNWTDSISLLTISLTARKQGVPVGPVVLTQKVRLRALP
ncbi:MAG: hypothetical protein A4E52_01432 [Pelotomaculum sp. PtaB.Bin013]|uniref:Prepilin-type N-terminal cleavage/methylation domain-containing protein n=1 Tax=Pelotomaculum isophthalicicum JI TaxID=947010 RepID=A0A9X4H4B6_9FIRM|nr:prepilin-type N-terminal cleavage/methylation domain-containing protein [Pelotomaculum isophthalicicum]MDF9408613.1 prepilin-type N-terminal cleavage/methylation domain-containing protein [Pelotomaculum isophthalicicum JI]OPX87095.1 MAG: hypothetical protein A4E52_01432 [Pelotomaculum sp. PtaB.Bin013]